MSKTLGIGQVLRRLRVEKSLTLQQIADMLGVTASYLSQLENEKVSPSIQTLKNIADVLEVSILEFFENALVNESVVSEEKSWTALEVNGWGAYVRQMVRLTGSKRMQPFFTIIPPGQGAFDVYTHPGEEFVYVLEGTVTISLDGKDIEVKAGSAAYFSAMRPHNWRNLGDEVVKMIWVCSPPSW
jgi:transcriptional regulator with XRE-family HTH domain